MKTHKDIALVLFVLNLLAISLGFSLRAGRNLQIDTEDLFVVESVLYGDYYTDGSQISTEKMCDSIINIYASFGNTTTAPYDSCPKSYEFIGQNNPIFSDSLPQCYSDVQNVFCSFELSKDESSISLDLFDFMMNKIIHCIKVTRQLLGIFI